jgi:hypothetical protein
MKWNSPIRSDITVKRKYAWIPTRMDDGTFLWFEYYYERWVFHLLPMDRSFWEVAGRTVDHPNDPGTGSKTS